MSTKFSILIADDEKPFLLSLRKMIQNAFPGNDIFIAADGLEAWNIIRKYNPNIVISDLNMPQMDGIGLLKRIRSTESFENLYFILVTADAEQEQKNEALKMIAQMLREKTPEILEENAKDMEEGEKNNLGSMLDRLMLNKDRVEGIAKDTEKVADLHDFVGEVMYE